MTEQDIINELAAWIDSRKYPFQLPRSFIYDWESDYWAMDQSGITREYEIKISKSDFRKDKLKEKHNTMHISGPNYFYYVCPAGLIAKSEVDRRYGLIYISASGQIHVVKRPLKLHGTLFDGWKGLAIKMYWKWWKLWREKLLEGSISHREYRQQKNNIA